MLSFQRLDVYQRSIEFLVLSSRLIARAPKGHAALVDPLRRAALSVPLGVAEASERDGARHYAIAPGSAMACAAIMYAARVLGRVSDREHAEAVRFLARIVAMTAKLCR